MEGVPEPDANCGRSGNCNFNRIKFQHDRTRERLGINDGLFATKYLLKEGNKSAFLPEVSSLTLGEISNLIN